MEHSKMEYFFLMITVVAHFCEATSDQPNFDVYGTNDVVRQLTHSIENHEEKIRQQHTEIEQLTKANQLREDEVDEYKILIHDLMSRVQYLETRIEEQSTEIVHIRNTQSEDNRVDMACAFSAYASEDRVFVRGSTILYDVITTNIGNSYNETLSVFTCPVNGIYLFTVSVLALNGMEAVIRINNDNMATAYSVFGYGTNAASTTVMLECEAGDRVQVLCGPHQQCEYYDNSIFHAVNSFSGILVYAYPE